jgi:hypothetical protein
MGRQLAYDSIHACYLTSVGLSSLSLDLAEAIAESDGGSSDEAPRYRSVFHRFSVCCFSPLSQSCFSPFFGFECPLSKATDRKRYGYRP